MYRFLVRKLYAAVNRFQRTTLSEEQTGSTPLYRDLKANLYRIENTLGKSGDVVFREFSIGLETPMRAALVFIEGLANRSTINDNILNPLQNYFRTVPLQDSASPCRQLRDSVLCNSEVRETETLEKLLEELFMGNTALLFEAHSMALIINTQGFASRAIEEPDTEAVVRGPREGFTENLRTNTSLLRRKIRNPKLRFEHLSIGTITGTKVCLAYIQGIASPELVVEVRKRLTRIRIDSVLESGYIEGFIEDAPFSVFATVGNTEKPDILAGKLLEGRLGIIVDGTPMVLTVPHLFVETLQTSEDYYTRPFLSTMNRWIRIAAMIATTGLPAFYVSLNTFHPEMIPSVLLVTMAAAKEGVPLPVMVETLFMAALFEAMREAGVRLPRPVGQSVSIVGALVLGEAAIRAGFVSAPTVILTGITAITSFILPAMADAFPLIRVFLVLLAGIFGLYGVLLGVLIILIHLVGLRSFGVPYLSPLAPLVPSGLNDVLLKTPVWAQIIRPQALTKLNPVRVRPDIPHPDPEEGESGA